ncbi:hypothetical protein J6S88_07195 [bacterium]|nr:hypothetical protein [bacterium]
MKKIAVLLALLAIGFASTAAFAYEPWGIGIYTGTKESFDYAVPGATLGSKVGKATCKTILGIVNWGDCSVKAAMKDGRMSRVTSADWEKHFVLIYGEKTLTVYGN